MNFKQLNSCGLLKFSIAGFMVLFLPQFVFCSGKGTSALQFLSLRAGSRAESLGGAVTAIGDDLSSLSVNPASVSRLRYNEALFSQTMMFQEIKYSYIAYGYPTKYGLTSFEYMNLSYGDFDRIDRSGTKVGIQSPNEMFIGLGWSLTQNLFRIENMDMGGVVRYFKSDLEDASASGISLNLGGIYRAPMDGLTFGMSVNHLGNSVKYMNDSFSQPRTIRFGMGYATDEFLAMTSKAKFSLDGVILRESNSYFAGGIELFLFNLLSLQFGYAGEENAENKLRYGMGIGVDAINLNYSVSPADDLGATYKMSVRMRFGHGIWNLFKAFTGANLIEKEIGDAKYYKEKGDLKRSAYYAHKVLKRSPEFEEAKTILKEIEEKEREKMAQEVYGEAIALIRLGLFNQAEERIEQCIELNPKNKDYQEILKSMRMKLKEKQTEEKMIRENLSPLLQKKESEIAETNGTASSSSAASLTAPQTNQTTELSSAPVGAVPSAESNPVQDAPIIAETSISTGTINTAVSEIVFQTTEVSTFSVVTETCLPELSGMKRETETSPEKIGESTVQSESLETVILAQMDKNAPAIEEPVEPLITEIKTEIPLSPLIQEISQPLDKNDIRSMYQKAVMMMQERNTDEAIKLLKKVIIREKNYEDTPMRLAECLKGRGVKQYAKGNYQASYYDFQEALKFSPKDPALRKFLKNVERMLESLNYTEISDQDTPSKTGSGSSMKRK